MGRHNDRYGLDGLTDISGMSTLTTFVLCDPMDLLEPKETKTRYSCSLQCHRIVWFGWRELVWEGVFGRDVIFCKMSTIYKLQIYTLVCLPTFIKRYQPIVLSNKVFSFLNISALDHHSPTPAQVRAGRCWAGLGRARRTPRTREPPPGSRSQHKKTHKTK